MSSWKCKWNSNDTSCCSSPHDTSLSLNFNLISDSAMKCLDKYLHFAIFVSTLKTQHRERLKLASMKCIELAKDLKPNLIDMDHLTRGSAKYFFEHQGKKLERRGRQVNDEELVARENIDDRTATLGSEEFIYSNNSDCGLFASVVTAYNNHWKLRTSPDDWWFVITRRVAYVIDKNSKKEAVRKMFVNHDGKVFSYCCSWLTSSWRNDTCVMHHKGEQSGNTTKEPGYEVVWKYWHLEG